MKKVLIITYYWPPAGGVEVVRVAKFCKYLRQCGWQPEVLTVEPGRYGNRDEGMCNEIASVSNTIRTSALEPHTLFHALSGKGKPKVDNTASASSTPSKRQQTMGVLGEYIRLNLFIPDARIGWYPFAVRAASKAWNQNRPDLIFSTAPPYTVHLIAQKLQQQWQCPWVADFRDPWVENYAYNTVPRLPWIKKWNLKLETKTLRSAQAVICATPRQLQIQSSKIDATERDKFHLITNGYDAPPPSELIRSKCFYLSYFGTLSRQRLPEHLLPALQSLCTEDPAFAKHFCFRAIGRIAPEVQESIRRQLAPHNTEIRGHLPLDQLAPLQQQEQVMLVLVDAVPFNELIIPAKIFEILPTGNPILGIGPTAGDAAQLVQKYAGGEFCKPADANAIKAWVKEAFRKWQDHALARTPRRIPEMERTMLTKNLASVFDGLMAQP